MIIFFTAVPSLVFTCRKLTPLGCELGTFRNFEDKEIT